MAIVKSEVSLVFNRCLQMWPDLIAKAKEGGLDVIQTYVFWNGHEPSRGVVCYGAESSPHCAVFIDRMLVHGFKPRTQDLK